MSKMTHVRSIRLAGAEVPTSIVSPIDALNDLLEGNQRFVAGESQHPDKDASRRRELVGGQHPPAAVLSCSDSRVPPEIVFDRRLGDLFVVRNAGNVAGQLALESLRYAVAHLGTRLIVTLGHTGCGAVTATVDGNTSDIPETAREIRLPSRRRE
jgi:carbonic anhydrase